MIEIDPKIADADALYERVKTAAKMKNIPQEFYNETLDRNRTTTDLNAVRDTMIQVYQNLQIMNASWAIEEKPLASAHPIVGPVIVFCKKVYRKLTRWLFQTYYMQQTNFNAAATKTVSDMIKVQEMMIQLYEEEQRKGEKDED